MVMLKVFLRESFCLTLLPTGDLRVCTGNGSSSNSRFACGVVTVGYSNCNHAALLARVRPRGVDRVKTTMALWEPSWGKSSQSAQAPLFFIGDRNGRTQ